MNSEAKQKLDRFVDQWLDGELDHSSREELNFLLRDHESNRTYFNSLVDLQSELRSKRGASIYDSQASAPVLNRRIPRWLIYSLNTLAIAASVLVFLGLSYWYSINNSKDSLSPRVTFAEVLGAELFDGQIIASQSDVQHQHDYVLKSGMLHLEFPSGARAILEGPSVFRVTGGESMLVKLGKCSVHAPQGAEGFIVETPQTEVVDLGTRFVVDVNEVGQTDVQVIEGAAEVAPLPTKNALNVGQTKQRIVKGEAVRFDKSASIFHQAIPFDQARYTPALPDRVVSYQCDGPLANQLINIKVQRGQSTYVYNVDELIRIRVVHFEGMSNAMHVAAAPGSSGPVTDFLEKDNLLSTGLINPGGSKSPLHEDPILAMNTTAKNTSTTPGLGIFFTEPVINSAGPDVVFFELNSQVDAADGDGFHVSPVSFREGLMAATIQRYDITMKSAEALPVSDFVLPEFATAANFLKSSMSESNSERLPSLQFYVLSVGIDLSDLGYLEGETCDGIFIQDDDNDNRQVDPVFIAGLPPLQTNLAQEIKP